MKNRKTRGAPRAHRISDTALQNPGRRGLLVLGAGLYLPGSVTAAPLPPFETLEITIPGAPSRQRRALVLLPRERTPSVALPVLLLLHGLGETSHPQLGLRAWLGPYGLGRAWERLVEGFIQRERFDYLSDEELAELGQPLKSHPFSGLCIVCPFLPNPYANGAADAALSDYATWLSDGLLPALRAQVPEATSSAAHTGIAGVSLGGFAALEVFLRRSNSYGTVGTIQGAFGVAGARVFAKRLAASGAERRIWVSTSTADPYRKANEVLAKELEELGVAVTFSVRRGPHSQAWLREIGSVEMLLWHDRALRSG